MKNYNEENKPASELSTLLKEIQNDLHQKQQLFIAQTIYADALENIPSTDDSSPEAKEARQHLEKSKTTLENLIHLVNDTSPTLSS